jgi:GNAT superfamily N-acetyltransferase
VLAALWLETSWFLHQLAPDDFRLPTEHGLVELIERDLASPRAPDERHLVAVLGDEVAGVVSGRLLEPGPQAEFEVQSELRERRLMIDSLGVASKWQRQGIATALVEEIEGWAATRGARCSVCDTYLGSPQSLPFWERRAGYTRRSVRLLKPLRGPDTGSGDRPG